MTLVSLAQLRAGPPSTDVVLIDVREPKEFSDGRLGESVNVPSSSPVGAFLPYRDFQIALVCHSGGRAKRVYEQLMEEAYVNVRVLDVHIDAMDSTTLVRTTDGWTVDRQFRFLLGVLLLTAVAGLSLVSSWFIVIPMILGLGLTITALIDQCYLRMAIARLPWNRGKTS